MSYTNNNLKSVTNNAAQQEQERSVLGAIIIRPALYYEVNEFLYPFMFTDDLSKLAEIIWEKMQQSQNFDVASLAVEFGPRGERIVSECMQSASLEMITSHASSISERYLNAQLLAKINNLLPRLGADQISYWDAIAEVTNEIEMLNSLLVESESTLKLAQKILERADSIRSGQITEVSISTGHKGLDNLLMGWNEGDLGMIMARPYMGKTATMVHFFDCLAKQGVPSAFISLELISERILNLMAAPRAGVPVKYTFDPSMMTDVQYSTYVDALGEIADAPIFIRDSSDVGNNFERVADTISMLAIQHDVRIVFIDFIQCFIHNSDNTVSEIGRIAFSLASLAKKLRITIIIGSQLSRITVRRGTSQRDYRPTMADARGSGMLEEAADWIIGLHGDDYYNEHDGMRYISEDDNESLLPVGVRELNIMKNRVVQRTGSVYTKYRNYTLEEYNLSGDGGQFPAVIEGDAPAGFLPDKDDDELELLDDDTDIPF